MKKVLILLVALLTVPAMAASNVTISCANVDDVVTVSYTTDPNLIRGFGLDITVDDGNVTDVNILDPNYRIYPGQIVIVDGNVTDYNTPYASGTLNSSVVTVELASLYTLDANYDDPIGDPNNDYGYGMQPGTGTTPLLSFTVDTDCNYTVTENAARGGVVMENPDENPNVSSPLCSGQAGPKGDCLSNTAPEYADWVLLGKPDCWCYRQQCRGDIDGIKSGPFWVGILDLNAFKLAFGQFVLPPGGECADLDHIKSGPFRVSILDLNIFKTYFGQFVVPQCDAAPVITGPYNYWTN